MRGRTHHDENAQRPMIPRAYRNDPNAPWNDPPVPECPECQNKIREVEDHTEWCENQVNQEQLFEQLAEDSIATEYDPMEHQ